MYEDTEQQLHKIISIIKLGVQLTTYILSIRGNNIHEPLFQNT